MIWSDSTGKKALRSNSIQNQYALYKVNAVMFLKLFSHSPNLMENDSSPLTQRILDATIRFRLFHYATSVVSNS